MVTPIQSLHLVYAIQNVGGIDFHLEVGDTVPVKHTLQGLKRRGHNVLCLKLHNQSVRGIEDVASPDQFWLPPAGISGSRGFRLLERLIRRLQRDLKIPYFAFIDSFRFYESCIHCLTNDSICHEHNGLFCIGAAFACRRLGIPYVLTFSADPLFERNLVGRPLRGFHYAVAAWEARFTYNQASKIICVSNPAKQRLVDTWKVAPEKVVVLPNGVDSSLFNPHYDPVRIREALELGDSPVVGFLGGFQPWHGIEILVESLAEVVRKCPGVRLLLIGDGRARPSIERKIDECNLRSKVVITGLVPPEEAPKYLAAVDVAALPYPAFETELWFSPLKLYEYMASGKAIVASRAGQIAEVLVDGTNGLLVEPGDRSALSAAIVRLLENPEERYRLGQNARRQAVEQHSWDRYIQRLEQVYASVLEPSS
jgi:glycosyltransferase involved in cell wall biosynthesis